MKKIGKLGAHYVKALNLQKCLKDHIDHRIYKSHVIVDIVSLLSETD